MLRWTLGIYGFAILGSMATMSIGAALVFGALLLSFGPKGLARKLMVEAREDRSRSYLFISFALAVACALSLLGAELFPLEYWGKRVEVLFFKDMVKALYLFWPFFLAVGFRALDSRDRVKVLRAWMCTFVVFSLLGVFQYFTGWPRHQFIPGNETRFHATLFLGHHLSVASVWIFPFFYCLDLLARRDRSVLPVWASALGVGAGLFTLIATYSRMLWIALPLGLFFWVVRALPRKAAWGAVIAGLLAVGVASQLPVVQKRMTDTLGVGTRKDLWEANFEFFQQRPLTGAGWHHNQELSGYYLLQKYPSRDSVFSGHAHSNLLEMLGATGAIGFVAWLIWCGWVFRRSWPSAGFASAWLVFHVNGLTQVNFWESKVLHQIMWVVAWLLVQDGREDRNG